MGSIANNPRYQGGDKPEGDRRWPSLSHAPQETLYDQPLVDTSKRRVTGPFSVEAVPAPFVKPIDDVAAAEPPPADDTVARSGETLTTVGLARRAVEDRHKGQGGAIHPLRSVGAVCRTVVTFTPMARRFPMTPARTTVAEGAASRAQRVVVSFGPDHAPLEQRQVNQALQEAQTLMPQPKVIVFAAFQFDPEAAKDIDETNWPGITLLKAQMNADLLTEDLKKKRASNESFWLIGQPDVLLRQIGEGENTGKWQVEVQGFDYYNTKTGGVESGGEDKVAMWMLDTDYDGAQPVPSGRCSSQWPAPETAGRGWRAT